MKQLILKLCSTIVAVLLCTSAASYAFATDSITDEMQLNEYEYIKTLAYKNDQNTDDSSTLLEKYYSDLNKRAALPKDQLIGLGYTETEIAILKKLELRKGLSDAELKSVSATLTGKIIKHSFSSQGTQFSYQWEWNHCPIVTDVDAAAISWTCYNTNGHVATLIHDDDNDLYQVFYYFGDTHVSTRKGKMESGLNAGAVNMRFDVAVLLDDQMTYMYAKKGIVKVSLKVPDTKAASLAYVYTQGAYGHKTVGIGSPSVSISSNSISFSVSPGVVEKLGFKEKYIS